MWNKTKKFFKEILKWVMGITLICTAIAIGIYFATEELKQPETKTIKVAPCSYHYNDAQRVIIIIYPVIEKKKKGVIEHKEMVITKQDEAATYPYIGNFVKVAAILDYVCLNKDSLILELQQGEGKEFKIQSVIWEDKKYQLNK